MFFVKLNYYRRLPNWNKIPYSPGTNSQNANTPISSLFNMFYLSANSTSTFDTKRRSSVCPSACWRAAKKSGYNCGILARCTLTIRKYWSWRKGESKQQGYADPRFARWRLGRREEGGWGVVYRAGARNAIFGFSNARDESARCISVRIDSDKDRAFWVSPGAIANSYPARATSYISEYLRRPAPSASVSILRRQPRLRTTSNFGRIIWPPSTLPEGEEISPERESVEYLFSFIARFPSLITCIISD